jgi:hypothetical protein
MRGEHRLDVPLEIRRGDSYRGKRDGDQGPE